MDVQVEVVDGDVRMRAGKYVCPSVYVNVFTPIEFEEIAHLFDKFDEDRSGELSMNEIHTLLLHSDIEFDDNYARDLLEALDEDKSGLIDFAEFCTFLARVKTGHVKLKGIGALIDILNATPAGLLEERCLKRHLKISYDFLGERPATAVNPVKTYLMEVRLEGEWVESSEGGMKSWVGMRRFQGIGKTTREGRMSAAQAALGKLRNLMPGLDLPDGELPAEWERLFFVEWSPSSIQEKFVKCIALSWLKNNAKQGVSLESLLAQLRHKGFAPYANPGVMQWALAFTSFDRLIRECPTANPTVDVGREVGPELRAWVDHCLSIGLEGAVLVEVIQDKGISMSRMEAYAQRLRRGDGASCADVLYPRLLDFWQIVNALVLRKADVDATDMMGRTALHHAAKSGEVDACIQLLEHSASLSAKDSVGCTPLHVAARYNKANCCKLLAFHGEEIVRNVVNDRIPVAERPFTEILEASFHHMLKVRLKPNEAHRFRKDWIYDAVYWCREQVHEEKKHLLQEPNRELVEFVVRKFDPDPEAGFWQLNAGHPPTFIPSVVKPLHLSEIIRHIFRLAVCGAKDNRGWTALHQACFENHIASHEETIRVLADFYQLDFFQVDKNGKLAVELVFAFENGRQNTPSGSRLREALLIEQRKEILTEYRKRKDEEDKEKTERGRMETLLRTCKKAVDMDNKLWLIAQEASLNLRTLGGWMEFVDTESLNRFYHRKEVAQDVDKNPKHLTPTIGSQLSLTFKQSSKNSGLASPTAASSSDDTKAHTPRLPNTMKAISETGRPKTELKIADADEDVGEDEDIIDHFQWEKPKEFAKEEAYLLGWASVIDVSEFVRTHAGRYNAVLNCKTGVMFYVDTYNETCQTLPPREATLSWAFEHSAPTIRVVGQRREWEVRIDQDGNEFYCSEIIKRVKKGRIVEEVLTRDLRWERPVDAVQPVDLTAGDYAVCTMDVAGYERAEQPWYICNECDAEWKGDIGMFRVCVACARNCHKERLGHRTRFCKISNMRCMCCERNEAGCLYFTKKEEVVHGSLEKRHTAVDEKAALDAAEELDRISPPMLAYVPDLGLDGTPRNLSGWQICRRKRDTPTVNGWAVCHDPELPRRITVGTKVRPRCTRDAKVVVRRSDGQAAARRAQNARITKGVFFWRSGFVVRAVSDYWYIVQIDGRAADDTSAEEDGMAGAKPLEWKFSKDHLCMEESPLFFFHEERRECTWEFPLEATPRKEISSWPAKGCSHALPLPHAANQVLGEPQTIVHDRHDRHDGRTLDEGVAKGVAKGGKAPRWGSATLDEYSRGADGQTFSCGYPPLCADEWESMRKAAKVLYIRGRYTAYLHRETISVFYHDEVLASRDKRVTTIQRKWRRMKRQRGCKRIPPRARTEAFSFEPFEELKQQMRLCTAWAYLRRSALLVRQVNDRDGDIWEEYQDSSTGLRFFYCPDLMKSRFDPPDLLPSASEESNSKARLKVGDRVAFRFRSDKAPSTAEVVKVRETQDRTDAGDTVVSVHYDVTECEINHPRSHSTDLSTITAGSTSTRSVEGSRGLEDGGGSGLRTERWLSRQVLTKAPKTAEEMALDEKEVEWRRELTVTKSRRHRELSRRAEEQYRADRLRKRGPAGMMLVRRERGRTALQAAERRAKRAVAEKELREEEDRLAVLEAQETAQQLLAAKDFAENKRKDARQRRTTSQQSPSKALAQISERTTRGYNKSVDVGGKSSVVPAIANADPGDHHILLGPKIHEDMSADNGDDMVGSGSRRALIPKEGRIAVRQDALIESLRMREDRMTTPRTVKRRGLIRMVHMAMVRQADGFVICEWGCRAWVRLGQEMFYHQTEQCSKRILPCELGCGLRMREEEWLEPSAAKPEISCQQHHEGAECPRRLVPCKQRCGEWLPSEELMHHMEVSCVKRPFLPIKCRLGCGEAFEGGLHRMLQSEEERIDHEHDLCPHRLLHCVWAGCQEMVMSKDRKKHRQEHVTRTGVFLFTVPGKYIYKVPRRCRHLKVQAWGAGGGSGHFEGGQCGDGGGGAFAEAMVHVSSDDELEITVGGCGSAGVYGSEELVPKVTAPSGKAIEDFVDRHGVAEGGFPGGGNGHGGSSHWAAGGGGGYSMVAKKINRYKKGRTEPVVVAGGGGGGGSRAGVPGGGLDGEIPGTKVDIRNGRMGTATAGGAAGDSGDINGCTFPPKCGKPWEGGDGGQYGGGGGSGWFGGGGGGTTPGIMGGGGGGSSFINTALVMDLIVLQGIGQKPGGTDRAPPRPRGENEEDILGGTCGAGGKAGPWELNPGKNGAVRIHKPGFFKKQLGHN